jgi:hypothetical protein
MDGGRKIKLLAACGQMDRGLNFNQRNVLEVEMRELEETILNLRSAIREDFQEGNLTIMRPLSVPLRESVNERFEKMLLEIHAHSTELQLRPGEADVGRRIVGYLSNAWSNLQEMRVSKLKRYGKTNPELANTMEPYILNLAAMAMEVCRIVEQTQPAGKHKGHLEECDRKSTNSDRRTNE